MVGAAVSVTKGEKVPGHSHHSLNPTLGATPLSLLRLHQQGMRIDVRSLRQDVQEAKAEEYATTLERGQGSATRSTR